MMICIIVDQPQTCWMGLDLPSQKWRIYRDETSKHLDEFTQESIATLMIHKSYKISLFMLLFKPLLLTGS